MPALALVHPQEYDMIITLLALMGSFNNDPSAKTKFMEAYDPERAQRIALSRDDDKQLQIIVSNDCGPLCDGATEILQATTLVDQDGRKTYLLTMQKCTESLGDISPDDERQVALFLVEYFSGQKKDVVLSAKSDPELTNLETFYIAVTNDEVKFKNVTGLIADYVVKDSWVYVFNGGKIGKIEPAKLDANLGADVTGEIFIDADLTTAVGRDIKLARGSTSQLNLAGKNVETITYLREKDGKIKIVFLDCDSLAEVYAADINSPYATFGHDGKTVVMVGRVIDVDADGGEKFVVTVRPADEVFALA